MEDIETVVNNVIESLYDEKKEEKLKQLRKLVSHHDREHAFHHRQLITAILRTLSEVKNSKESIISTPKNTKRTQK